MLLKYLHMYNNYIIALKLLQQVLTKFTKLAKSYIIDDVSLNISYKPKIYIIGNKHFCHRKVSPSMCLCETSSICNLGTVPPHSSSTAF